jgi:glycogen synthase
MTRIVMAVNNAGSNDYRVVKSAELLAAAGYECVVVGLRSGALPAREIINGVHYLRVDMARSRWALLPALVPGGALLWNRLRKPAPVSLMDLPQRALTNSKGMTSATTEDAAPRRGLHTWLRRRLRNFRPATAPLSVRLLFARYVQAYLPLLLALDADIYHAHELWMLETCALAARAQGAKLFYDSHELEPHRNLDWCPASNRQRIRYEQRYIHAADAVFTVSPGVARQLMQIYGLPTVGLLRNTPWLARLRHAPRGLRATLALADDVPLVVYTGLVTFNRGLELVVRALSALPGFHLAMVGPVEAHTAATLARLAAELGIAARVHHVAPVPPEELIDFIATGDVAVIAAPDICLSYRYSLPNKLFEALFADLPLVISDLEDMRDFVTAHGLGEVFAPGDVAALSAALRLVVAQRGRYVDIPQRERLRQCLSFDREAVDLLACYRQLTARISTADG